MACCCFLFEKCKLLQFNIFKLTIHNFAMPPAAPLVKRAAAIKTNSSENVATASTLILDQTGNADTRSEKPSQILLFAGSSCLVDHNPTTNSPEVPNHSSPPLPPKVLAGFAASYARFCSQWPTPKPPAPHPPQDNFLPGGLPNTTQKFDASENAQVFRFGFRNFAGAVSAGEPSILAISQGKILPDSPPSLNLAEKVHLVSKQIQADKELTEKLRKHVAETAQRQEKMAERYTCETTVDANSDDGFSLPQEDVDSVGNKISAAASYSSAFDKFVLSDLFDKFWSRETKNNMSFEEVLFLSSAGEILNQLPERQLSVPFRVISRLALRFGNGNFANGLTLFRWTGKTATQSVFVFDVQFFVF